jgi:hypothetical protein
MVNGFELEIGCAELVIGIPPPDILIVMASNVSLGRWLALDPFRRSAML